MLSLQTQSFEDGGETYVNVKLKFRFVCLFSQVVFSIDLWHLPLLPSTWRFRSRRNVAGCRWLWKHVIYHCVAGVLEQTDHLTHGLQLSVSSVHDGFPACRGTCCRILRWNFWVYSGLLNNAASSSDMCHFAESQHLGF